mgnify:CR=1 FL=1
MEKLRNIAKKPKNILEANYNVYLATKDEEEFFDTMKMVIKNIEKYESK